jgi:hypothetical protein
VVKPLLLAEAVRLVLKHLGRMAKWQLISP